MNRLEKAIERVEKSVNISFAGPTPNSLLARQDLESAIVVLSDRQTPFRDRVSRIKGEGLAHLWNQRTRLDNVADGPAGLVNLFYADGNLPNTTDPNYVQQTAAFKYLGTTAVITGPMIASGRWMRLKLSIDTLTHPSSARHMIVGVLVCGTLIGRT